MDKTSSIQTQIDEMVFSLGLNSELQMAEFFSISPSAITKWKKNSKIPLKYSKIVSEVIEQRISALQATSQITVSVQEVAEALGMKKGSLWIYQYRKKNPRLYAVIEDGLRIEKIRTIELAKKGFQ